MATGGNGKKRETTGINGRKRNLQTVQARKQKRNKLHKEQILRSPAQDKLRLRWIVVRSPGFEPGIISLEGLHTAIAL